LPTLQTSPTRFFPCFRHSMRRSARSPDGWQIGRLGKPELAILRLALYEMLYDEEVPFRVAINEAVELAKKYCNPDASGFINAVLAKVEEP